MSIRALIWLVTYLKMVCMTLPGGGLRLQTLGRLATQLFDSTLRTLVLVAWYCSEVPFSLVILVASRLL